VNDKQENFDSLMLDDQALVDQCEVDCFRASGPGGQKRNKTSSGVRLRHRPTGLVATAVEDRSQHVNKRRAIRRLRLTIALNIRSDVNLEGYAPGEQAAECITGDGRIIVGRRDHRYAGFVGELLDVLVACDLRIGAAADLMGVSTGRLVSFLKDDPKVWERVNQMRTAAGHKALR